MIADTTIVATLHDRFAHGVRDSSNPAWWSTAMRPSLVILAWAAWALARSVAADEPSNPFQGEWR